MDVRNATHDDLDEMANIMCAAFPMDPQWDYRFPHRHEYPEDNWKCTRKLLKDFLEKDHFVVRVATSQSNEDKNVVKPVSLAVWELRHEHDDASVSDKCDDLTRRDADPERMRAFDIALSTAKEKFFDAVYADNQIHLWVLGTHPDYQRRGFGTKQCLWGLAIAKERSLAVTLFSSPMGKKLYSSLEFQEVGNVTVQVEGEEEKLSIAAMAYETQRNDKRGFWGCFLM